MNKWNKLIASVLTVVLLLAGGFSPETLTAHAAAKTAISAETLTLKEDQSKILTVKNTTKTVNWKLSTKKYVSYEVLKKNQIRLTGKQPGVTKITAVIGKQKFTCKVTVNRRIRCWRLQKRLKRSTPQHLQIKTPA